MQLPSFQVAFSATLILAQTALTFRLIKLGLASSYRWFTGFLIFESVRLAAFVKISRKTNLYGYAYFATEPVLWLLQTLMTLEVFQTAFRHHPGIATTSRKLVTFSLGVAIVMSIATFAIDLQKHNTPHELLLSFIGVERVIYSSLLFFVLLLMIGLGWFPVPLSRNALIHAAIFTFFFTSKTVIYLVVTMLGSSFSHTGNVILLAVNVISLCLWGVLLTKHGESSAVVSGVKRNAYDEQRLMKQLESLNRTLSGSRRK